MNIPQRLELTLSLTRLLQLAVLHDYSHMCVGEGHVLNFCLDS